MSFSIKGTFKLVGQIKGTDIQPPILPGEVLSSNQNPNIESLSASDSFAAAIATYGDYTIVTAYTEDVGGANTGTAYVYQTSTGLLLRTISGTIVSGNFGTSVDIYGTKAVIGARGVSSSSGAAYIYDVSTGNLLHTLNNPNVYGTTLNDWFGESVSISDSYVVVGAILEDELNNTSSGKAYVFDVNTGSLLYTLDNPNVYSTSSSDYFGKAVSVRGNYIIVGVSNEDDPINGNQSGAAYIFDAATGNLLHTITSQSLINNSLSPLFGSSVAITDTGAYSIIGANAVNLVGIYDNATGRLIRTIENPNVASSSIGDQFGWAIDTVGNYVVISAKQEDFGASASGTVYVFEIDTGNLVYTLQNPNIYGTPNSDEFGHAVGISEFGIVVGAYLEDSDAGTSTGTAYFFKLEQGEVSTEPTLTVPSAPVPTPGELWTTYMNPIPYTTDASSDYFGEAVATSGDYTVVGSWPGVDENRINAGIAYIYKNSTGQRIADLSIPANSSANSLFGQGVAIDVVEGVSYRVFISAPYRGTGHVYIYDYGSAGFELGTPTITTITNPLTPRADDRFGEELAAHGNYLVVGSSYEDMNLGTNNGAAFVYDLSPGNVGNLLHTLSDGRYATSGNFGYGVAIHNGIIAVISYSYDIRGRLEIFDAATGIKQHSILNPDVFGGTLNSVSIYDGIIAIGDSTVSSSTGKVHIYNAISGAYIRTIDNPALVGATSDQFGASVSVYNNRVLIGAPLAANGIVANTDSGRAYLFDHTTGNLVYTFENPIPYNTGIGDKFGHDVTLGSSFAVIGAPETDDRRGTNSGAAHTFKV